MPTRRAPPRESSRRLHDKDRETTDALRTSQPLECEGRDGAKWAALAEKVAGFGYWHLDVSTRAITWSDGLFGLYGFEVGDAPDLEKMCIRDSGRPSVIRLGSRTFAGRLRSRI